VVCSECGMNLSPQNYTKEEWQESFKYCPCCGARMDGDAE
jgi:predicted  nucleic acid-binding Zn-ribbon protein